MNIPYRTRRTVKRVLVILLAVILVAVAVWACWLIWLQRFIVYTADGDAVLDFDLPPMAAGQIATQPQEETVPIYYNEGEDAVNTSAELTQLVGYYVEPDQLQNLKEVKKQMAALEAGTGVMIDVKNIQGDFYYSSAVGANRAAGVDTEAMDELIAFMNKSSLYTIARLPALRDYAYGLNHVPNGVHHSSGLYLYQDDEGCYWLNPASEGTLSYLTQIVTELKTLGFDEVVFYDFCYPGTDSIQVDGSRPDNLTAAAATLTKACTTEWFALSFEKTEEFTMPEGRNRMYLSGIDAAQAASAAENSGVADPLINLVFLTELYDTRFNAYSVLRPLSGAH